MRKNPQEKKNPHYVCDKHFSMVEKKLSWIDDSTASREARKLLRKKTKPKAFITTLHHCKSTVALYHEYYLQSESYLK